MKNSWPRNIFLTCLRWLVRSFFDLRVNGVDKLPESGGVIVAGNHPNLMDGVVLGVVSPRPVRFLVAADTMRGPAGVVARWLGAIPVDRSGGSNRAALSEALKSLERGEVVGIFPEGKTSSGRELLEFKKGVALLAHRSGAPVVPCAFEGTQDILPKGAITLRPRTLQLVFGSSLKVEPVASEAVPEEKVESTLGRLRTSISGLWASLREQRPRFRPGLSTVLSGVLVVPISAVFTVASGR